MDATEMSAEELRALADEKSGLRIVGAAPAASRRVTVTALGVTIHVDHAALDDYELFETLSDMGDSASAFVVLLRALCGNDREYRRVKDELRDERGRLPLTRVAEFVQSAEAQMGALKN